MSTEAQTSNGGGTATASDTLTITDNRTGRTYEVPIEDGTIRAIALRDVKVDDDDFGLMTYDPAYLNTASTRSSITFIDGDRGILEYRGYPIEQLAEKSTYLEVAYLLIHGELPTLAAFAYRHSMGQPYNYPVNDLAYSENFLNMMFRMTELRYEPDPKIARALDILFILHADHEQ